MKKLGIVWMICLLSITSVGSLSANANAGNKEATKTEVPTPEVQRLLDRVEEIKKMDVSTLSVSQRKELKQELRTMKKEMKAIQGFYISLGAAIIIILLLILIL